MLAEITCPKLNLKQHQKSNNYCGEEEKNEINKTCSVRCENGYEFTEQKNNYAVKCLFEGDSVKANWNASNIPKCKGELFILFNSNSNLRSDFNKTKVHVSTYVFL